MTVRAALYARRSTTDQPHSLAVQREEAHRYATAHGWTITEEHIDDGHSGAEFTTRPALRRLLGRAEARALDVVIVRSLDRLGRDTFRVGTLVEHLRARGVTVHTYTDGRAVAIDDPSVKLILAAQGYAAEMERLANVARTTEVHRALARRGKVTGGRVYGYRNVRGDDGTVTHVIDETEAATVRDIFRRYIDGRGYREIAHALNAAHIPPPRTGDRTTGQWGHTSVREVLHRERYTGRVTWGRTTHVYEEGTRTTRERPESELVVTVGPAIIDAETWTKARGRERTRARLTTSHAAGKPAVYLLTGFARCTCGGPMNVSNTKHGTALIRAYLCTRARSKRGDACSNTLRRPVEELDSAVVNWIREHVLNPALVEAIIARTRSLAEASAPTSDARRDELTRTVTDLQNQARRLAEAVARAPESEALLEALSAREARLRVVRAELANLARPVVDLPDPAALRTRLADLGRLLADRPERARDALASLLTGPIVCTPVVQNGKRRYHMVGRVVLPCDNAVFADTLDEPSNQRRPQPPQGIPRGWAKSLFHGRFERWVFRTRPSPPPRDTARYVRTGGACSRQVASGRVGAERGATARGG